ncbi:hypothetical protein GAYE_SCF45G5765 [Galdieria yellowstonensis]|uniref:Uncharacterized protein n=1 Tax=Galdieria yellowstonensis TaxID=3028027 RepID=A0AAV9IKP3_9RHOD|nr:hypothetical protein GAYE_SCF45G5765 [Galdieria yellowstonensis]
MYELERAVFQELFQRVLDNHYQVTPEERKALVQCDNSIVRRGIFSAVTTFSLIYYGLKQFQKYYSVSNSVRLRPGIPATLLGLTTGFLFGRTAAPGCLQSLVNIPDSAVAEEVKIIMREMYERSPSSTNGQAIASRYSFVLNDTSMSIPDTGFGESENSDWKQVDSWQTDNSADQKPIQKRVGPRNPDKRRLNNGSSVRTNKYDRNIHGDVATNPTPAAPLPSNNSADDGLASIYGEYNAGSQPTSDTVESWDTGNDSPQGNADSESNFKRESHRRRRRRNERRKSSEQSTSTETDPTEQGTIHADTKDLLSSRQDTDVLWSSSSSDKTSSATAF